MTSIPPNGSEPNPLMLHIALKDHPSSPLLMDNAPREADSGPPTHTNTTDDSRQSPLQNIDEATGKAVVNDRKILYANVLTSELSAAIEVAQRAEVNLPPEHATQLREERIRAEDLISMARRHLEREVVEEVYFRDLERINEIIHSLALKTLELAPHTTSLWTDPVIQIRRDVHEILRSVDRALDGVEDLATAVLGPDLLLPNFFVEDGLHISFPRYFSIYGGLVS